MRLALSFLIAGVTLCTGIARAEVSGPYVTGLGILHQVRDGDTKVNGVNGSFKSDIGFGFGAAAGYQFNNGFRVEGEATYRLSAVDEAATSDNIGVFAGMVNLLWEYDNPTGIYPYVGGGLGFAHIDATDPLEDLGATGVDNDITLAGQAIVGVGLALTPNLTGIAEYRYFHAFEPEFDTTGGTLDAEYRSHAAMVGLRYRFGSRPSRRRVATRQPIKLVTAAPQPIVRQNTNRPVVSTPPAVQVRPVVQAKAAASLRRTYVVFFATDSSALSSDARAVVQEATNRALQDQTREIDLTGHADTVGARAYNQALSVRRAEVAASMLRSGGVKARLRIFGKGEADLLVPTADNVAEPRNRRVDIVLRGTGDGLKVSRNTQGQVSRQVIR